MAFKCTMSKGKKALGIQPVLKDSWQGAQRKNTALLLSVPGCPLHRSSFSHYSSCPLDKGELARGSLPLRRSHSWSSPPRPTAPPSAFLKQRHHRGWWSELLQPRIHVSKSGYFCPRLIQHVAYLALTSKMTHPGLGRRNAQMEAGFRH